jgi:hypothetical protein
MSPALLTIAKGALFVVIIAAFLTCMWTHSRLIERMRESGSRYWLFNPTSIFSAWATAEFPLFVSAVILLAGAVFALKALG